MQFNKILQKTKKPKAREGKKGKFKGRAKHKMKGSKGNKDSKALLVLMKQLAPALLAKIQVKVDNKEYHWCYPLTGGKCPVV